MKRYYIKDITINITVNDIHIKEVKKVNFFKRLWRRLFGF